LKGNPQEDGRLKITEDHMGDNIGSFKREGGNPSVNVVVKGSRCVIEVGEDNVSIDGVEASHGDDARLEVDAELYEAFARMMDVKTSQEQWIITNISNKKITLGFTNMSVLLPGQSIDGLMFALPDEINDSPSIQGARRRGLITLDIVRKAL
jgi:hypothetical protein